MKMMKTLLTTAAVVVSLAGAAQAQNMFGLMQNDVDSNTSVIDIQPLNATADGYVAIYEFNAGTAGKLLGVASVTEGANLTTRVQLGRSLTSTVIAYLFVGDDFMDPAKAVDSVEIGIAN